MKLSTETGTSTVFACVSSIDWWHKFLIACLYLMNDPREQVVAEWIRRRTSDSGSHI